MHIGCRPYSSLYATELIVYSFSNFLSEIFGNLRQFSGNSHVNISANDLAKCCSLDYFVEVSELLHGSSYPFKMIF